ncbi:hypothetical protein IFM89_009388 [Coptis chinensis]|uniref:Uncharacterized protein n=1 Tax=Coptis chinensis TaxID=261450 RepID=A0A835LLX3_9MAGN|nr:hypothetical protein IFM89_009388 [Coptis chinensis]
MKPIPFSEEQHLETSTPKIEMKSLGCPEGTVPILRVQEEVLQRASYLPQRTVSNAPHAPGHHFVLGRIRRRDNLQLYAGKTVMTVYNPKLIDGQFSEAAIWLSNGPPDQLNSIQKQNKKLGGQ